MNSYPLSIQTKYLLLLLIIINALFLNGCVLAPFIMVGAVTKYGIDAERKLDQAIEREVTINSSPEGARVIYKGSYIGTTPLKIKLKKGDIGAEIRFEKEGYIPASDFLVLVSGDRLPDKIHVDLQTWAQREDTLISNLKNKNPDIRKQAVSDLRTLVAKEEVINISEDLFSTLIDRLKDTVVRHEVVQALGEIGDARAVEPLIRALKNTEVRNDVVAALVKIGKPAVVPLIKELKDENLAVQKAMIMALGEIKDPQAIEPLIEILKDDSVAFDAALALAEFGVQAKRSVPVLIKKFPIKEQHLKGYGSALYHWRDRAKITFDNLEFDISDNIITYIIRKLAGLLPGEISEEGFLYVNNWLQEEFTKEVIKEIKKIELESRCGENVKIVKSYMGFLKGPYLWVTTYDSGKNPVEWFITHFYTYDLSYTVYAGACSLKKITGEDFGNDQNKWQEWWEGNKTKYETK